MGFGAQAAPHSHLHAAPRRHAHFGVCNVLRHPEHKLLQLVPLCQLHSLPR